MRKIIIVLLSVLLLAGCGQKKTSLADGEFTSLMTENGYQVYDDKDNFSFADHAYVVLESDLKVVFVEGKRKVDIEGIFVDQCNNVYNKVLEGYDDIKKSGSNWSTLKIIDSDNYYYISLVDDSYLYIEGSIDNERKIDKIIDLLNY